MNFTESELVEGQVDHTLQPGVRVAATEEDLDVFRKNAEGTSAAPDKCVLCARQVTFGDFGLDHVMYYNRGDSERKVATIRTFPRIWCVNCAKQRSKQMKKHRVQTKQVRPFSEVWLEISKELAGEGQTILSAPEAPEDSESTAPVLTPRPPNEITEFASRRLIAAVTQLRFEAREISVKVQEATYESGSIDAFADELATCEVVIRIQWSGHAGCVESLGTSRVRINGAGQIIESINTCEPCAEGLEIGDESGMEMMLSKSELLSKVWRKKVLPLVAKAIDGDAWADAVKTEAAKAKESLFC